VTLKKAIDADGKRRIAIANLGHAEAIFENRDHFRSVATRLLGTGIVHLDDERWGGWLGRCYEKVRETLYDVDNAKARSRKRSIDMKR